MPTLYDTDRETSDYRGRSDYGERSNYRDQHSDDREISLSTGTILGIFFALALLCAVFFGFGYSMGRKSAPPVVAVASVAAPTTALSTSKPSPGSPLDSSSATKSDVTSSDPQQDIDSAASPITESYSPKQNPAAIHPASRSTAPTAPAPAQVKTAALTTAQPQTLPVNLPQINPNGTAMVQVAAVSHQEDADTLLQALKKRGYAVIIRQEPQDHLMHVQVGPFTTRKEADIMRQRLLADGYNAIVK